MGGGWYEIQQFVDNITCKNFNMVMIRFQTTTNSRQSCHGYIPDIKYVINV